jgi:hypothetical protein
VLVGEPLPQPISVKVGCSPTWIGFNGTRLNLPRLQVLVESGPAAIVTLDANGTILLANEAAQVVLASGRPPLRGQNTSVYQPGYKGRFGWNNLRHSLGTFLAANEVNLPVIQSILRHSKPSTTAVCTHRVKSAKMAAQTEVSSGNQENFSGRMSGLGWDLGWKSECDTAEDSLSC